MCQRILSELTGAAFGITPPTIVVVVSENTAATLERGYRAFPPLVPPLPERSRLLANRWRLRPSTRKLVVAKMATVLNRTGERIAM